MVDFRKFLSNFRTSKVSTYPTLFGEYGRELSALQINVNKVKWILERVHRN